MVALLFKIPYFLVKSSLVLKPALTLDVNGTRQKTEFLTRGNCYLNSNCMELCLSHCKDVPLGGPVKSEKSVVCPYRNRYMCLFFLLLCIILSGSSASFAGGTQHSNIGIMFLQISQLCIITCDLNLHIMVFVFADLFLN